ncbi:MAG: 4-(cytidine 5'-diphospho)-2-C-methyl-D-erythritol kinase [Clostridia bacterium]|nr:4-(cytidine 5'-diphospho)-2-C-methyl-D-erythritol kinase [Clostridia bacterium]
MEKINAYAKINLTLSVTGKRADGYHDLESVMHAVDVFDTVYVEKADNICVECDTPIPENNTAYRAAKAYFENFEGGAHIKIEKGIPSEAGMGGASADAAAVLRALQKIYGAYSEDELFLIGKSVGADVPFCMLGGCATARGIGEILTPVKGQEMNLLIVKGSRGVSTPLLFSKIKLPLECADTQGMVKALEQGDVKGVSKKLYNALEKEAQAIVPEIAEYKKRLIECGALGAQMTGSGSAVFGIFESLKKAQEAQKEFQDVEFARVCRTICN